MRDNEFTRIPDWPGYQVFRHETRRYRDSLVLRDPDDAPVFGLALSRLVRGYLAAFARSELPAPVLLLDQTFESLLENPQHTSDAVTEDPEDNSSVEELALYDIGLAPFAQLLKPIRGSSGE
jgi:hypothetical protein